VIRLRQLKLTMLNKSNCSIGTIELKQTNTKHAGLDFDHMMLKWSSQKVANLLTAERTILRRRGWIDHGDAVGLMPLRMILRRIVV
jgi:hypothetical protein